MKQNNTMKEYFDIPDEVVSMVQYLKDTGHEARLVGGCVRDMIMQTRPNDYDIATTATPEEMIKMAQQHELKYIETGLEHGTIIFVLNGMELEVTTLRKDTDCDGRHATVEFTDNWQEDALRRDFTMNAMSMDVFNGQVYDYFGGQADIESEVIQFVGNAEQRIKEDYLRIIRAYRFAITLDFTISKADVKTITFHTDGLESISKERILMELKKIHKKVGQKMRFIFQHVWFTDLLGLDWFRLGQHVRSEYNESSFYITLIHILRTDKNITQFISFMPLSNNEKKLLTFIAKHRHEVPTHEQIAEMFVDGVSRKYIEDILVYHNISTLNAWTVIDYVFVRIFGNEEFEEYVVPKLPVSGDDVMQKFKHRQGPWVGDVLNIYTKHWKNTQYRATKDDLLNLPLDICSLNPYNIYVSESFN